jgi:small conductance mechanosensitive channel
MSMNLDFTAVTQFFGKLTISTLLPALIYLIAGLIISKLILSVLNRSLDRSNVDVTLHKFLHTAVRLVLHFIVFMVVAGALGIQVTSLVAILSVAGLAISLSVQGLLSNVLSGLMLLSIKPFKVGDYVEVGGMGGTVREIGFVHTKLLTLENCTIYIPNSEVSNGKIMNYSTEDKRRFNLKINVSYECPPEKVRKVLLDYISAHPQIDREPAPFVAVSDYKESSIEYVVRAWADNSIFWDVYWDLFNGLDDLFRKNGIAFTYPNLNVHVKQ